MPLNSTGTQTQIVVKGPMTLALLALCAVLGWYDLHDYATADLQAAYSGTVVAEGTDYHLLGRPRWHRYIVIRDSTGHQVKRYVDERGYLAVKVGTFVVKGPGYGEVPHEPGSPLPR